MDKITIKINKNAKRNTEDIKYLNKEYFKKNYRYVMFEFEEDKDNFIFSLYEGIPSDKSFVMFGGLYDPESGFFHMSVLKNKHSLIVMDVVAYFNNNYGYATLESVNREFIKYKLSNDLDSMSKNIITYDKKCSIIARNINKQNISYNASSSFDEFINKAFFQSIPYIESSLYVIDEVCLYNKSFSTKSNIKISGFYDSVEKIIYSYNELDIDYESIDKNYINKFLSCCKDYVLTRDINNYGNENFKNEEPIAINRNIEELLDLQDDIVYTDNKVDTLKINGLKNYIDKDIENKINSIQEDDYITKIDNDLSKRVKNVDYFYYNKNIVYNNQISLFIKDIIYINKRFVKI